MSTPHEGEYLFLGTTDGQWPVEAWAQDAHARAWLTEMHDGKRRLYRVRISQVTEVRLVAPEPYLEDVP